MTLEQGLLVVVGTLAGAIVVVWRLHVAALQRQVDEANKRADYNRDERIEAQKDLQAAFKSFIEEKKKHRNE